jgi:hypothetical protein
MSDHSNEENAELSRSERSTSNKNGIELQPGETTKSRIGSWRLVSRYYGQMRKQSQFPAPAIGLPANAQPAYCDASAEPNPEAIGAMRSSNVGLDAKT